MGLKLKLLAASAAPLAVLVFADAALAQGGRGGVVPELDSARAAGGYQLNSWTTSVFLNTTDNFPRIVEGDYVRLFENPDGSFLTQTVIVPLPDGGFGFAEQLVQDTVPLEPFSKDFATLTFDGLSVVDRNHVGGILRGRLRVGAYFNDDTIDDVFAEEINSNIPQVAIDAGATPNVGDIGNRQFFIDPNISGLLDVDIVGKLLGVEIGGFAVEQNRLQGGQLVAQQPGQDINEIILGGVFISPVARFDLPEGQGIELRLRNSTVRIIDQFENSRFPSVREINDSVSNEAQVNYRTGSLLGGLELDFQGFARRIEEDGSATDPEQDLEQLSGSVGISIPIQSDFALTGVVGYDELTTETSASPILNPVTGEPNVAARQSDFSGVFYSAGFNYRPTKSSRISLGYGRRFQGQLFQADIQIPVTARVAFTASANRRATTGTQAIQEEFAQFNVGSLQFLDRLRQTNSTLSDRSLARSQFATNQGFTASGRTVFGANRLNQVRARLTGVYSRTSWTVGANAVLFDEVEEDERGRARPARSQYSSFVSVTRQMSRRFTVSASGQTLFLDGNVDDTDGTGAALNFDNIFDQFYSLQFNYTLNRDWGLALGYTHLRRDVQGLPEGDLSLFGGRFFEYRENQLRGGLQFVF